MGLREGREVPRKRLWGSGTRLTEGHSQGGSEAPFLLCKVETMHTHLMAVLGSKEKIHITHSGYHGMVSTC